MGRCMPQALETEVLPHASPVVSPACWCLGVGESFVGLSASLSSIEYSWVPSAGQRHCTVPLPSVVVDIVVAPADNCDNLKLSTLFLYLRQC